MNILMLTASMGTGGAETHVLTLAETLVKLGHRVTVASEGGSLCPRLRAHGVRHLTLPLASKRPSDFAFCYCRLARYIRREHIDLLHAHARLSGLLGSLLSRRLSVAFVTTAHANFRAKGLRRALSRWGSLSSAVSEDLRDKLIREYGVSPETIRVIPNGIDLSHFCPPISPPSAKTCHIVSVSRLDRDCAATPFLLCSLIPHLRARYGNVTLSVVGGGSAFPRLRELAERINRRLGTPCIRAVGNQTELLPILHSASLLVGVSRAALEAMACSVPVLLSGGEGFLGLLEPELWEKASRTNFCGRGEALPSKEGLLAELERFLALSAGERYALGNRLRGLVCRHHEALRCAKDTLSLYEDAMKKIPASRGKNLLVGYYGRGNCGDDLLLEASLQRARRIFPDEPCSVIAAHPRKTSKRFGVRSIPFDSPLAIARELRWAKRLIIGGGSILQDATSLRSLLYYTLLVLWARRRGLTVQLWGNGLGPLLTPTGIRLTRLVLRSAVFLEFRDKAALSFALRLGAPPSRTWLGCDPAYTLLPTDKPSSRLLRAVRKKTSRPFAVFAVSKRTSPREYTAFRAVLYACRASGILPVFVRMSPEDNAITARFARVWKTFALRDFSPWELRSLLSEAQLACSNRYHLLVLSDIAQTPCLGIGSDPKIRAFRPKNPTKKDALR